MIFLTVPFSVRFFTKTLSDLFNFCLDKGEKGDYNLPVKNDGDFSYEEKSLSALFQPVELTQGECWKTILAFSFPIIVSYLLQQVYTISDAAIVGQTLTAQEVAGVNDTTSLIFIFLQFAFGVSAGFCVVTSCNVGAHNPAGVRRSLTTQIVLSAALTVILTVLALLLLDPMLAWINVTPDNGEVYRAAYTYCAIILQASVRSCSITSSARSCAAWVTA